MVEFLIFHGHFGGNNNFFVLIPPAALVVRT